MRIGSLVSLRSEKSFMFLSLSLDNGPGPSGAAHPNNRLLLPHKLGMRGICARALAWAPAEAYPWTCRLSAAALAAGHLGEAPVAARLPGMACPLLG